MEQEGNMALLWKTLDIEIAGEDQETPVGDFRADVVATEVSTLAGVLCLADGEGSAAARGGVGVREVK